MAAGQGVAVRNPFQRSVRQTAFLSKTDMQCNGAGGRQAVQGCREEEAAHGLTACRARGRTSSPSNFQASREPEESRLAVADSRDG